MGALATFGGSIAWVVGSLGAGIDDQPAFPTTELGGGSQVEWFTLIASAGVLALVAGAALLLISVAQLSDRSEEPKERWSGLTLEWLTASPPILGNFPAPPVVTSATPLMDGLDLDESPEE